MKKLIECVPNFSEGRDSSVIEQISNVIKNTRKIRLLHIDKGYGANRTVMTFAGEPEQVINAAYLAIQRASELIDMRFHSGEHPRIGATDVCPLVPLSGVSMDETVQLARRLAKRVGNELNIPVYCYEYAAFHEKRRNLAHIRSGEYEGFAEKIRQADWQPDFGPAIFNLKSGATAIGARNFLIAYNVNLSTSSAELAKSIAADVRELGKFRFQKDEQTRKIMRDKNGEPLRYPGGLKKVRAIGWHIKEYGIAQVSMNLDDIDITPLHIAFEEVRKKAVERGVEVTGSEIIGLVPLRSMLEAGRYFLHNKHSHGQFTEEEIVKAAVHHLGLNNFIPFEPEKRIIEYLLSENQFYYA